MKKLIIPAVVIATIAAPTIYHTSKVAINLADSSKNDGITYVAYLDMLINPNVLVLDLVDINSTNSMADVFRTVLQTADAYQKSSYDRIIFAHRGDQKFYVDGDYFKMIGEEYATQNPLYTMRTFTQNVHNMDGTDAYSTWTGGLLGVMGQQMKDHNDFHMNWYMNDMVEGIK